jgi:hypothetical protein
MCPRVSPYLPYLITAFGGVVSPIIPGSTPSIIGENDTNKIAAEVLSGNLVLVWFEYETVFFACKDWLYAVVQSPVREAVKKRK